MTRKALVIAVLTLVMSSHMTACSSSAAKDDSSVAESNDETFAEEGEGDFADTAASSAPAKTDQAAADALPADGEQPVVSDAKTEDTNGDLSLDGGDQAVAQNSDAPPADAPTSGQPPADAPLADAGASTDVAAADTKKPTDELSLDDAGGLPEDTASSAPPAAPSDAGVFDAQKPSESVADAAPPVTSPDSPPETPADVTPTEPVSTPKRVSSAVSYAPLMKVKSDAFTAPGGATLNRVYIARPKDTPKSIAQKIYSDPKKSKDLVKWNPVLKRGVRAGDKVYYASATNPSDSKMMNLYEENGVAPQTYVSKDGDNLRTVSKTLLGFNEAWKEVWETNPSVDSKGKIPAGLTLAYWPTSAESTAVQKMASSASPTGDSPNLPSTLPDAAPQIPPQAAATVTNPAVQQDPFNTPPPTGAPPSAGQPVADAGAGPDPLAPPPPNDAAAQASNPLPTAAGSVAATDPLAPPPGQVPPAAAATTKPVAKVKKAPVTVAEEGGMDPDTTMALGVGGVLLLAVAVLVVFIRKNRAKRMDLGQTQV